MSLRTKLLLAFLIVLLPMLALIVYDYEAEYRQRSEEVLDNQIRTSQAIGALVDASIDDALAMAWAFSRDPILRTMDYRQIDPYLESMAPSLPQYDNIAVLDLNGDAVGLMAPRVPPGAPRPSGAQRRYFETVKSTGQPVVSEILISRATGNPTAAAVVPMRDDAGTLTGMTLAALDLDYLARRVETVGLQKAQAIFVTDPEGTIAFHTLLAREEWGRRTLSDYPPVQSALRGALVRERETRAVMDDLRMVAATRTARFGWVVGVSVPTWDALGPVQADLVRRLLLFASALAFAALLAVLLSRRLIIRPLEMLKDHMVAFGRGQLARRVDLRTGDEMELVAQTFNQMANQLQQASEEREKLERQREAFISVVAHDLRGAMTSVKGYADYLLRRTAKEVLPEDARRALEVISSGCQRVERMVDDLLDVSRIEAHRLTLVKRCLDLASLAKAIVQRSGELTKGHPVRVEVRGETGQVEADPDRIEQVLSNLLSNAAKYSYPQTEIKVEVAPLPGEVMVAVTNLGPGILPEDRDLVFTRYYRTRRAVEEKAAGLGLGLYIAKGLVEAHGGRIWVESEPGVYATFRFTLPLRGQQADD